MSKVYDIITEQIIDRLESGTVPWRKPWASSSALPCNLASGKPYRGINVFLLHTAGYASPHWVTFKQALALGGNVRKGEKSSIVIFWQPPKTGEASADARDDEATRGRGPVLRYYRVFNLAQCEGLENPAAADERPQVPPIKACEAIAANMPSPPLIEHGGARAFYEPRLDRVRVPDRTVFDSAEHYYATLFHELGHATGHASRLARKGVTDPAMFGSHDYSREELVAEMTAAFLCGRTGIAPSVLDSAAAYVQGWLRALRGDSRLVIVAAAQAQKAADYITGAHAERLVP